MIRAPWLAAHVSKDHLIPSDTQLAHNGPFELSSASLGLELELHFCAIQLRGDNHLAGHYASPTTMPYHRDRRRRRSLKLSHYHGRQWSRYEISGAEWKIHSEQAA